jgi:hypothetical protein
MNSKNLMIKSKALFVAIAAICVCSLGFISCEDEAKSGGGTIYDPSKPVEITSFMPDSGRIAEMVLLDGSNFGTDVSNIKVFFNSKEAVVLSSTGSRILALVPRLPGDTCIVSVEVGDKKVTYPGFFRYKVEASVTTLAGNGNHDLVVSGSLETAQFGPVYLGIDKDNNLFVSIDNNGGMLLKMNEKENSVMVVATNNQGMSPRFQIAAHPETAVMMMGGEGAGNRDRFIFLDPKENWVPKQRFIRNWITNDYPLPANNNGVGEQNYETHYHCLYCQTDGYFYTRYTGGQLVKINPKTWEAEIIFMTKNGVIYGMAFHPNHPNELWMAYSDGSVEWGNSLCTLDVTNPEETYTRLSGITIGGHRDGRIEQAMFNNMRQINFDPDGNLYIGDSGNHCIRRVDTDNMMVETIVGIPGVGGFEDGKKENAKFNSPHGLVTDSEGVVYVSDHHTQRIRRIAIE